MKKLSRSVFNMFWVVSIFHVISLQFISCWWSNIYKIQHDIFSSAIFALHLTQWNLYRLKNRFILRFLFTLFCIYEPIWVCLVKANELFGVLKHFWMLFIFSLYTYILCLVCWRANKMHAIHDCRIFVIIMSGCQRSNILHVLRQKEKLPELFLFHSFLCLGFYKHVEMKTLHMHTLS